MDSMDWWTNTPLLTFPPLTVCPLLQQCLVTTGVLLRKAGCCRQQWQAGLAGSPSADCLLNHKRLQMSQTPCCGNTDTRSGSTGITTICPQIMRIFKMFILCLWAFWSLPTLLWYWNNFSWEANVFTVMRHPFWLIRWGLHLLLNQPEKSTMFLSLLPFISLTLPLPHRLPDPLFFAGPGCATDLENETGISKKHKTPS